MASLSTVWSPVPRFDAMLFASSISAIDTGRVAFAFACSSNASRTLGFVRGMRAPVERTSVRALFQCPFEFTLSLPAAFGGCVPVGFLGGDAGSGSLVDLRSIDFPLSLHHRMGCNRPYPVVPNCEHDDQIPSGSGCALMLFAGMITCGRSTASSTSAGSTPCRAACTTLCKSRAKPLMPTSTVSVSTDSVHNPALFSRKGRPNSY